MFSAIRTYLEICRVSNIPTVWTNVLAGVVLTGADISAVHYLVIALSMSLFYSAGMSFNDICDLETDIVRRPSRPLPSGRISLKGAYAFTMFMFAAGLGLLVFVPYPRAVFAALILLGLIVLYDKFHTEHPFSVLLMAGCRFMVFVISSVAVSGEVLSIPLLTGAVQFVYTLAISITARYEKGREQKGATSVIPAMIAGISLLDGGIMAAFLSPAWFIAGFAGALLTIVAQRYIRGD